MRTLSREESMRPLRKLVAGASYNVIAKINRDECILTDKAFKELFLTVIKEAKKKYDFSISTFCILDNLVKMIISPGPRENLSRIMQWILSVFAVRYNRIKKIHGHVWYDRFKSSVIDTMSLLHAAFTHITESPLLYNINSPVMYLYNGINCILRGDYSLIERPPNHLLPLIEKLSEYAVSQHKWPA